MDQWAAVNHLLSRVKNDPAVRAVFLKGSLARREADEYSDVDFYCLVHESELPGFLERRLGYMQSYRPLVFWSEANFVGPQIVGVFDDGLHFDLYTVTQETLQHTDQVLVLHDPEGLLAGYASVPQTLTYAQLADHVDEFSFGLLEFEAAFRRQDTMWASRLASHLSAETAFLYKYLVKPEKAAIGFKGLSRLLDDGTRRRFEAALDGCAPSSLPEGVIRLCQLVEDALMRLPHEVSLQCNTGFLHFMIQRISALTLAPGRP